MKKSTLIVQSILAAAIIALYILHFTGHKTSGSNQTASTDTTNVHVSSGKIAYILIDSIFSRYEFAKELMSKLDTKQSQLDADLKDKGKNFQSSALDLQNKMQKGLITRLDAEQAQQQLASQQQNLYALQNQYTQQIAEENQVNQRKILNSVMDYLKEYNKTKHY